MSLFNKKKWKDVVARYPNRRKIEKVDGEENIYKVDLAIGVLEEGNKFEASELNDLEERIDAGFDATVEQMKVYSDSAFASAQSASDSKDRAVEGETNASKWAIGTTSPTDIQYNNNAKYYAEQAKTSETNALTSSEAANISAGQANDYATTALNYRDAAKTNADNSAASVVRATEEQLRAEGYATGTQNGVPVTSGEYYHNNAKWYSEKSATTRLVGMEDVEIINPADKQALVYDANSQKWVNGTSGTVMSTESQHIEGTLEGSLQLIDCARNLIPFPYSDGMSKTVNGITYTVNTDGSVTANGTATSDAIVTLSRDASAFLKKGNVISGGISAKQYVRVRVYDKSTGAYVTAFTSTTSAGIVESVDFDQYGYQIQIVVVKGQTVNNVVFKPMLEEGSVAHDYVPYTGYTIKTCNRNLIPYPYLVGTQTLNGVDFTFNADGSVHAKGRATATMTLNIANQSNMSYADLVGKKLTLSGCTDNQFNNVGMEFYTSSPQTWQRDYGSGITFDMPSSPSFRVGIFIRYGTTVDTTFYPMLEYGEVSHEFEVQKTSSVDITKDTKLPLILDAYKGVTNILSPSYTKVNYALNESGKGLLDEMVELQNKATAVEVTPILTEGTKIAEITVDGKVNGIFAPEDVANMRYNETTDMIQIKINDGWNNWKIAGFKEQNPLIPAMLSNTVPNGYLAEASAEYNTSYAAYMAFDGISDINIRRWIGAANTKTNQWVKITFPYAQVVKRWSIWTPVNGIFKNYELQASKDGNEWVSLGGIHTNTINTMYTRIDHELPNNFTEYSMYRVFVYDLLNTDNTYISIGEIQLYGDGEPFNGYLYYYGDECSRFNGGWSSLGYSRSGYTISNATKNLDHLSCISANNYVMGGTGIQQPFDFTEYNKMEIVYRRTGSEHTGTPWIWFGTKALETATKSYYMRGSSTDVETLEIDLSDVIGHQYFFIGCDESRYRSCDVYSIKLLK